MPRDNGAEGGHPGPAPSAPTEAMPEGLLAPGQVLGGRYQIRSQLGRGGMGEVWRAFDLKLRVEVALKALLPDLFKDERRRDLLRREVRAAREVVSPNVCRIFDLIEVDGSELVSMEYVDGGTLLEVLQERGPLDLKEAQDIASQFLAGLEAIHKVGLIHRDVKPENIMLTRAGRVVVMDFGLARQEDSGAGTVSGTPAYMAPEQAAGLHVDARADVYSAGVVLAEMVSPDGIKNLQSRQSVWEGIRHEPARVPDSPWAPVLKKAVAKEPENRYNSAHTLTRALEDVTLRVEGAEDLTPYPGLASFTEADTEYFFGREAEIEAAWRRLEGAHLLAIVGPSGAGKTSFIRAGLVPNALAGWAIVRCTPANAAFSSLARVMAREMAGDADAMELAVGFDDPDVAVELFSRWRSRHDQALLVVDQFEELFTLNPPDHQQRFAELMGRLALEADVRVLLSLRDDFLMHCNKHEALKPVFSELTPLDPPIGPALRRALVQPAMKCGYRFEDDELVDEVLAEVEGERGALPLLAFAMAKLWEKRDRENGVLNRRAYNDIGGVGGALARHAEASIDRIGVKRLPIVRELFRNLVTAEGTRAVRDWDELLSIFDKSRRHAAEDVLRELIDARLLTSYEVQEEEKATRSVEIIHESLLANWPRLVRWQTQDADAAQLRDQLRQAARTWDEHDRSDDLLWTGSACREFAVWREGYPGGLSETEEAFGSAMTAFAGRRRRRRRIAATAVIAVLLAGLAIVGSFWQRSVREARRAEAQKLIALGQLELESHPSATVAYAIASVELADNHAARRLALEALWKGPSVLTVTQDVAFGSEFSPDGRWLLQTRVLAESGGATHLSMISADGSREDMENAHPDATMVFFSMITDAGHFVTRGKDADSGWKIVVWSVAENRPLAETRLKDSQALWKVVVNPNLRRALLLIREDKRFNVDTLGFDGTIERLGSLDFEAKQDEAGRWTAKAFLDPRAGEWLGVIHENEAYVVDISDHALSPPRRLGRHEGRIANAACDPLGRFFATAGDNGEIRLWSLTETSPPAVLQGPPDISFLRITADGSLLETSVKQKKEWVSWVWSISGDRPRFLRRFHLGGAGRGYWRWDSGGRRVARWGPDLKIRVWPMDAPVDAEPLVLSRGNQGQLNMVSFNPGRPWLASADLGGLAVWPLAKQYPLVIRRHDLNVTGLAFAPDGGWLASCSMDGTVRLWPLGGEPPHPGRTLLELANAVLRVAASPDGERILVGTGGVGTWIVQTGSGPSSNLEGFTGETHGLAFSADGRLAAAAGGRFNPAERVIRVWDVASGDEVRVLEVGENPRTDGIQFAQGGHLLSASESGLLRWNVGTGKRELLHAGEIEDFSADVSGRRVIMLESDPGKALLFDVDSGETKRLHAFGDAVTNVAIDPEGVFAVTGDVDGKVRVGLLTGEEPHVLLGHEGEVLALAIDPLGRWVASGSEDTTVRLWPMPDLSKPPLHALPREELIAKLKTLTNLRVVRDEDSSTGWKLTHDPFPGWETVPTW